MSAATEIREGVTDAYFEPRNRHAGAAIHAVKTIKFTNKHGTAFGTAYCGADVQQRYDDSAPAGIGNFRPENVRSCKRCAKAVTAEERTRKCPDCEGEGVLHLYAERDFDEPSIHEKCERCDGTGRAAERGYTAQEWADAGVYGPLCHEVAEAETEACD